MEREFRKAFGKQLRKEFRISDRLPDAIERALAVLASKHSCNDNPPAEAADRAEVLGTDAPLARKED
jgi:hypothetical protein